jgi:hypothetical protein
MKNLTAARDAVGSEEPIATGGRCFLSGKLNQLKESNKLNRLLELNGREFFRSFNLFNQSLI